jgi:hypothetical protein
VDFEVNINKTIKKRVLHQNMNKDNIENTIYFDKGSMLIRIRFSQNLDFSF